MVYTTKILGRLLIANGQQYMKKFSERSNGIIIMQHWLRRSWKVPALWIACFATLFGKDIGEVDFDRFDHFSLIEAFVSDASTDIALPEVLPVIMSMFRTGLISVTREDTEQRSAALDGESKQPTHLSPTPVEYRSRSRSLSLKSSNSYSGKGDVYHFDHS